VILLDNGGRARGHAEIAAPPAELRCLVEHVWIERVEPRPERAVEWRVVPDAAPHLIAAVSESAAGRALRVVLVGPRSRAAAVDHRGRVTTVGIRLCPGALPALVAAPAAELADRAMTIQAAFAPRDLRELELSADAPASVIAAEMLRLVRRAARGPVRCEVAEAITAASRVFGASAALAMPERTLRDRARREIGLSPKRTARILRLHRALHLAGERRSSWAAVALGCGYADQAHFTRECRELLGETPSRWIARAADSFKTAPVLRS
jgi:AraC-like DNA-binding protein